MWHHEPDLTERLGGLFLDQGDRSAHAYNAVQYYRRGLGEHDRRDRCGQVMGTTPV